MCKRAVFPQDIYYIIIILCKPLTLILCFPGEPGLNVNFKCVITLIITFGHAAKKKKNFYRGSVLQSRSPYGIEVSINKSQ